MELKYNRKIISSVSKLDCNEKQGHTSYFYQQSLFQNKFLLLNYNCTHQCYKVWEKNYIKGINQYVTDKNYVPSPAK